MKSAVGARRRLDSQDGMTIVEMLFAALIMSIGIIGMISAFDGSRRLNDTSERMESAVHVAQRKLEAISARPYLSIATTSVPAFDASSPANSLVCDGNGDGVANDGYRSDGTTCESAVTATAAAGGFAQSEPYYDDRSGTRGTAHYYVTNVEDPTCDVTPSCNGPDYKRLVVVLTPANRLPRKVVLESFVHDQSKGPATSTASPITCHDDVINCG